MDHYKTMLEDRFGAFPEPVIYLSGGRVLYANGPGEALRKREDFPLEFLLALAEHPGGTMEIAREDGIFRVTVSRFDDGDLLVLRALARFIMLDEPFAGVDPIAVEDIQSIVYSLKSKNIGILITDHNAPETLSITDRAYLLFEGKILFQGTSEELAENPTVRDKYLGHNFIFRRKHFD